MTANSGYTSRLKTYDYGWECAAKDHAVRAKNPNVVTGLNDPRRDSNTHRNLLTAIRVAIELPVLADVLVGQTVDASCRLP